MQAHGSVVVAAACWGHFGWHEVNGQINTMKSRHWSLLFVTFAEERQLFNCLEGRKRLEAKLRVVAEVLQFCASVYGVHSSTCNRGCKHQLGVLAEP